jgi:hypothetical protein
VSTRRAVVEYSLPYLIEFSLVKAGTIQNLAMDVYRLKSQFLTLEICLVEIITLLPILNVQFTFSSSKTSWIHNIFVITADDFNTPGCDWKQGLHFSNCHSYSKLKGDAIYTSTCLLSLSKLN